MMASSPSSTPHKMLPKRPNQGKSDEKCTITKCSSEETESNGVGFRGTSAAVALCVGGKCPPGRRGRRWDSNIKMDLRRIGCENMG